MADPHIEHIISEVVDDWLKHDAVLVDLSERDRRILVYRMANLFDDLYDKAMNERRYG